MTRRWRRKKSNDSGATTESAAAPWMITFCDLFLLLLTCFVLRLSMTRPVANIPLSVPQVSSGAQNEHIAGEFDPSSMNDNLTWNTESVAEDPLPITHFLKLEREELTGEFSFKTLTALRGLSLQAKSRYRTAQAQLYLSDGDDLDGPSILSAVVRQMIDAGVEPQAISAAIYVVSRSSSYNQNRSGRHLTPRVEVRLTNNFAQQ